MSMQFDEVVPVQEAAPRLVEVTEAPMGAVVLKVENGKFVYVETVTP